MKENIRKGHQKPQKEKRSKLKEKKKWLASDYYITFKHHRYIYVDTFIYVYR